MLRGVSLLLFLGFAGLSECAICYIEFLCKQKIGFFDHSRNNTVLTQVAVSQDVDSQCTTIKSSREMFCEQQFDGNTSRFVLKGKFVGHQSLSFGTQREQYFVSTILPSPVLHHKHVEIVAPSFGSVVSEHLHIKVHVYSTTKDVYDFDYLHFNSSGSTSLYLDPETESIESQREVQPGSIFYTVTAVSLSPAQQEHEPPQYRSFPGVGYLEYVQTDEQLRRFRAHVSPTKRGRELHALLSLAPSAPLHTVSSSVSSNSSSSSRSSKNSSGIIEVCLFSGGVMDGQKQIWMQQSAHMNRSRFSFTWVLHYDADPLHPPHLSDNAVLRALAHLRLLPHIKVAKNPNLSLDPSLLHEDPLDGRPPAAQLWERERQQGGGERGLEVLLAYAQESLRRAAYRVEEVRPRWCKEVLQQAQRTLQALRCDVVVYGTSGGATADVLIVDAAKTLHIPTVAEVMNLHIDSNNLPAVVVAPSSFALEHPDVQGVLRRSGNNSGSSNTRGGGGNSDGSNSDGSSEANSEGSSEGNSGNEERGPALPLSLPLELPWPWPWDRVVGVVISPSVDADRFRPPSPSLPPFPDSVALERGAAAVTVAGSSSIVDTDTAAGPSEQATIDDDHGANLDTSGANSGIVLRKERHPLCNVEPGSDSINPCIVIGFVARLSPGSFESVNWW
jgi:hypothetical protein